MSVRLISAMSQQDSEKINKCESELITYVTDIATPLAKRVMPLFTDTIGDINNTGPLLLPAHCRTKHRVGQPHIDADLQKYVNGSPSGTISTPKLNKAQESYLNDMAKCLNIKLRSDEIYRRIRDVVVGELNDSEARASFLSYIKAVTDRQIMFYIPHSHTEYIMVNGCTLPSHVSIELSAFAKNGISENIVTDVLCAIYMSRLDSVKWFVENINQIVTDHIVTLRDNARLPAPSDQVLQSKTLDGLLKVADSMILYHKTYCDNLANMDKAIMQSFIPVDVVLNADDKTRISKLIRQQCETTLELDAIKTEMGNINTTVYVSEDVYAYDVDANQISDINRIYNVSLIFEPYWARKTITRVIFAFHVNTPIHDNKTGDYSYDVRMAKTETDKNDVTDMPTRVELVKQLTALMPIVANRWQQKISEILD